MELVRAILLEVEEKGVLDPYQSVEVVVPSYTEEQVLGHVKLLGEAGLMDVRDENTFHTISYLPTNLTWDGHEFLDAIRNDTVWARVKATVATKGGGASVEIIKELAVQIGKQYFLGDHDRSHIRAQVYRAGRRSRRAAICRASDRTRDRLCTGEGLDGR
jgi:hypothetical protein